MSTEERRVRKSKKSIDDACWALLREKEFSSITVGEIAERADINRGTFYRHYADKYDWLERQIEQLTEELFSFRYLLDEASEEQSAVISCSWIFRHFDTHFDTYAILFSDRAGLSFQNRISARMADFFRERMVKDPSSPEAEFEVQFMAATLSGMLKWWVTSGRPLPPERMAQRMLELNQRIPWNN